MYSDEATDDPGAHYRAVEFVTDVGEFHRYYCYHLFFTHLALSGSVIQKSSLARGMAMIQGAIAVLDESTTAACGMSTQVRILLCVSTNNTGRVHPRIVFG
jgi:hypothetical protein